MTAALSIISLVIALVALLISALTFYFSRLKRGSVKMTRPTTIYFGPDGKDAEHIDEKKIFIRTLLFSTNDRGQYIQNMYVRLHRGECTQDFNVWIYEDIKLVRGSGLFVGKEGISSNHHFLLPRNTQYDFLPGQYLLEIFVETIHKASTKIFEQSLTITTAQYDEVPRLESGIFYDWAPNAQRYDAIVGKAKRVLPLKYVY